MTPVDITKDLVGALVRDQFPQWSDLQIEPVQPQGWDNRTFRLGEELVVRLPSAQDYVAAIEKEDRWLPVLAAQLRLPVPFVVATGTPGSDYPFPWSVRRWLPGSTVESVANIDRRQLARDLGEFLKTLRDVPSSRGPDGGPHSFFRGCHPSVYSGQVQASLETLDWSVDVAACKAIWTSATMSAWPHLPSWFHGDVAPGNLLAADGRLCAVIDFGTCGVGDPACDLVVAWTYFAGDDRTIFQTAVDVDDDTWWRARGWALWKALVTMAGLSSPDPQGLQTRVLAHVLDDAVVS